MANWDLSSTATSTVTPATAGDWTDETDHLIGTSLTNIDPTITTYRTTTVGRVDDVNVSVDWGTAFSQSAHTLTGGGAELAPPSDRGTTGQLWPR